MNDRIKLSFLLIILFAFNLLRAQTVYIPACSDTSTAIVLKNVEYKLQKNKAKSAFLTVPLPYVKAQNGEHLISIKVQLTADNNSWYIHFPFLNCERISAVAIDSAGKKYNLTWQKKNNNMVFPLQNLARGNYRIIFSIVSTYSLFLPIKIYPEQALVEAENKDNLLYSMYFGIVIIMSLYNLFIYFSTKSISYLYYVFYTIAFGIAQFALLGFFNALIVQNNFILSKQVGIIFSGISGIFGVLFFNSFLETKVSLQKVRKILFAFAISYFAVIVVGFVKQFSTAFNLLNLNAISVGLISLAGSAYLSFKNNRPARFFVFSWLAFMVGLVVFVLTNVGILPYNAFTKFVLPLSSTIEISLLSFALADKINILSIENATLIREQNIRLERQVEERTAELQKANTDLKETQAQLVNSEKMASLGHLTAGIAHEINNPINFISANITPLRRDIEDYETYMQKFNEINAENVDAKIAEIQKLGEELDVPYLKTEIESLLKGIDEGAKRTAEIVKNLKIFSHIDKAENSYYSLNEGIQSTLHLLSHKLSNVTVDTNLHELPPVLCFPGKINQVFMNILSNAVDALAGVSNPVIHVNSYFKDDHILIEFIDNGHGIPKEIQKDIFNPFFTTKEVGSGTGLGLSITLSLVHEHGGDIKVESEEGKGTKFILNIPIKLE